MNKDEYNPGWIYYDIFMILYSFFLLSLKEMKIKTFLWAPKSIMGPGYCTPGPPLPFVYCTPSSLRGTV